MAYVKKLPAIEERFWQKVYLEDEIFPENECMLWMGAKILGYGSLKYNDKSTYAHRFSYNLTYGPIPEGLEIDHLCFVRNCVNPNHLQPVTRQENLKRREIKFRFNTIKQAHCFRGHEFTVANTYIPKKGRRICRKCQVIRSKKYHEILCKLYGKSTVNR